MDTTPTALPSTLRKLADRFEGDLHEPDKLLCHVASLRRVALDMDPEPASVNGGSDIRFWTTLLRVNNPSEIALIELKDNGTHVTGPYWIIEGETDYLRDVGVTEVAEGSVPALGGLSVEELCEICRTSFEVEVSG